MKIRLGFLGSCATRDIFRSPHNVKYSDEFEVVFQQQRVTLISLMQNPIHYTFESTRRIENGEEKVFCSEWIRDDLSKSLFNELKKGINYLFIDMFFDVFFGVIIFNDTIITNNFWDSPFTDFYLNIENKEILTMCNNHDKYFELWKENCDKFFEYMKKEFPETKIVLNKIRGATKVVRKDDSTYISPSYQKRTKQMNIMLEELEQYIINHHDVKVIDSLDYAIAYEGHIWGRYFVHYIKDYYTFAYRQFKDIITQDKLSNLEILNSKITDISKEIELLSIQTQNLIKKNEQLKSEKINKEKIYDESNDIDNSLEMIEIGTSLVLTPKGYKILNKGDNGVLFSNDETYLGIYEVPKGGSFENKVKEWNKKYKNKTHIDTYIRNNITLKSVTVKENKSKIKETYFEKNGMKYHIFEKGNTDKNAFNTLINSLTVNFELLYNLLSEKVKKIPQLSCNSFGYSTIDGKIKYHNWRTSFQQRTLMDDFNGYCENIWFTRYLRHKFPNDDFKINFIGPFEEHHTLDWPMDGKKVFYSGENLRSFFPEMSEKFNTYALDYVDLSMGYDLIYDKKYLRFPFWTWYHFPPTVTEEEIENKIDAWNSLKIEKTLDVVNISSHDSHNSRKVIANDIEKIVGITYAGKWRNNTRDLWDKFNDNKKDYMNQFKFNICPENTMANGYVTEKIFDSIVSDCIPLYAGGGNYLEPKLLNHNAIIRWDIGDYVDNTDTIELFNNVYSDEKTYNEFKEQNILKDSSKKYVIKIFSDLEKQFERLIYE